jgi:hypothetical protein
MKVVYLAGPFRGKTPYDIETNVRRIEDVGLQVAKTGAVPLMPHTQYRFFQDSLPDEFWIEATKELLRRADCILMCPGWQDSTGSRGEHALALEMGMHVFIWGQDDARLQAFIDGHEVVKT